VKCGDPHGFSPFAYQFSNALLHLCCGLIRKGNRKDLVGRNAAFGKQICDPPSKDSSLSRSSACYDQQWRTMVNHRFALLWIEALK
jgi:hypothetical protein